MEITGKKSSTGLKERKKGVDSIIDAISDHVEKNENCEFVRIMEQFSKMDATTVKKFLEYAEKL